LTAFYAALIVAIAIRTYVVPMVAAVPHGYALYWGHLYIWWLPVAFLAAICYEGLYEKRFPFWQEARLLLKSVSVAFLIILAIVSLSRLSFAVSRLLLMGMWGVSLLIFPAFRWLGKRFTHRFRPWRERVLILGAGTAGETALRGLERESNLGYHVIGFLDDKAPRSNGLISTEFGQYKVFGPVRHFRKFVTMMRVSTIIIAMPSADQAKLARIVSEVQRYVRNVLLVPDLKGVALLNTELQALFMEQLFLLNIRNNLKSLSSRIIKRSFDLVVSTLLLVVLSPVFLAIYLAVKLSSPGSAFFVQYRPGKGGKIIKMYKFRTMYVDGDERLARVLKEDPRLAAEWRVYRKLKTYDPRVTSAGQFFRKWSLDELPQVFNVFKGEMSMVGPRPYIVNELDDLKDVSDIIFMAKPGICGLWQASGRNKLTFQERIELDAWYVLNWSLWLDVLLMGKTAAAVLRTDGAY